MEKQQVQFQTKAKTIGYVRWILMALYVSIYSIVSVMLLKVNAMPNHTFLNYCIVTIAIGIICVICSIATITIEMNWIKKIPKEEIPKETKIKIEKRVILLWMLIVAIIFFLEKAKIPNINITVEHEFIATFIIGIVCCIVMVICHHIRHTMYHPKETKPTSGYWI